MHIRWAKRSIQNGYVFAILVNISANDEKTDTYLTLCCAGLTSNVNINLYQIIDTHQSLIKKFRGHISVFKEKMRWVHIRFLWVATSEKKEVLCNHTAMLGFARVVLTAHWDRTPKKPLQPLRNTEMLEKLIEKLYFMKSSSIWKNCDAFLIRPY